MNQMVSFPVKPFLLVVVVLVFSRYPVLGQRYARSAPQPAATTAAIPMIQGTVLDDNGNPVAGAKVGAGEYVSLLNCGSVTYWTTTAANGSYALLVPPGNFLVLVNSHNRTEGYLSEVYPGVYSWAKKNNAFLVPVVPGTTVTGIDFRLPSGYRLTGRLVDGTGLPVLGAGGRLEDPVQKIEYTCALGGGSSNSDGTFEFNVPAGLYDLNFCAGSQCHKVFKGKIIRTNTSLGDIPFNEAAHPPAVFNPQAVMPGYNIEPVVFGGPSCASDVTVSADDKVYLAAVRSWHVYEVSSAGILSDLAEVGVYSLDAGPDGNLYGYFFPSSPGKIYKFTPSGSSSIVGTLPQTSCESTLAVAPNLDLWIGHNGCETNAEHALYRMTRGGDVSKMATVSGYIHGLDFDSSGVLFMSSAGTLYEVHTSTGAQTWLANIPEPTSHHGLVAGQEGMKYISTSWNDATHSFDRIYKVTARGTVSIHAEMPAGCLQGMAQMSNGDLIGTMRCTGALLRIHPNGFWEPVREGNGMSTPDVIAFNPDGELLVNNDESAAIVKIKNGRGRFFASVISFIPPWAAFAFLPTKEFYYSEAAPGMVSHLCLISSIGSVNRLNYPLDFPSGLAFDSFGQFFVVENIAGKISKVSGQGTVTSFLAGLTRPQPLAADLSGNLYVGDSSTVLVNPNDPTENPVPDRIWKVDTYGQKTVYQAHTVRMMAVSPGNMLFFSGPVGNYHEGILRVNSDLSLTPMAVGFLDPIGLAFDVAGNLYVADNRDNSIFRITGFIHSYVAGRITNATNGASLSHAFVSLITGYPLIKGSKSPVDQDGYFHVQAEARTYTLKISASGFCPAIQSITVEEGRTMTVNSSLQPCPEAFLPLVWR